MTLQIEGLNVSIMRNRVLHGVSLRVSPGELVCLVGRNGAGKTTTLRTCMGLLDCARGRRTLAGRDVTSLKAHQLSRLGLAYVLAFLAALLPWGILAKLVRMALHATPLSVPDRLLGGGFGLLRGLVLLLAVATAVALTPASQSQGWRASQGARWLGTALSHLKPLLPEPVARLVRT